MIPCTKYTITIKRHQETFTTDSSLLAYGEHSAYLQLKEMLRC